MNTQSENIFNFPEINQTVLESGERDFKNILSFFQQISVIEKNYVADLEDLCRSFNDGHLTGSGSLGLSGSILTSLVNNVLDGIETKKDYLKRIDQDVVYTSAQQSSSFNSELLQL